MASSSSAIKPKQKYDVFLSFRGEDTRHSFTSYLHAALQREKIETYMDDTKLERGDEIAPALLKAIEESKIALIIFSENYANSTWCLDELVHILECKQRHGQCVIPIFYEIDPSHVRNQEGSYATAIAQLEQRFTDKMDKVHNWRTALGEAAKLAGLDSRNIRPEFKLVDMVVNDILTKLKHEWSSDFMGLVGIESRILEIETVLGSDPQDVCVRTVGIWGMGGIGKTTLAEVVFHRLSSQFESSCFIANVREESSERRNLYHLRDKLYRKLLGDEKLTIETPTVGDTVVKMRLSRTKVLIVLDDVNDPSQSEFLVGNQVQFGPGSRIIVTTRDMQLLKKRAGEDVKIYEVKELNSEEAIKLFHLNAFRGIHPTTVSLEFSRMVIDYATGVPLALTVLGSIFLHCNSKEERESELRKLKKFPNKKIQNVLRASYDGLEENEKELFLDIACFCKAKEIHDAKRQLNACGLFADRGIGVLVDMSLISIKNNQLWMHDMIREMGWEIVRQQCYNEPGKRSRVHKTEDVCRVLERNTGTAAVQGISLNMAGLRRVTLTPEAFAEMHNLRFLMFYDYQEFEDCNVEFEDCNVCISQALQSLPSALGYLSWLKYPLTSMPSKFCAENLVELHLLQSKLRRLCLQNARYLKRIDLSYSTELVEVLELTKSLESITLKSCRSLVQVPDLSKSVNIESINFESCSGLLAIPLYFKHFTKLTSLNLCYCRELKILPEMPSNIEFLSVEYTEIKELPSSIWSLEKLVELNLSLCPDAKNILPNSTWKLNFLQSLVLAYTRIQGLPSYIDQCLSAVVSIDLTGCESFVSLPTSICKLKSLERLDLEDCSSFANFPEILEPMQRLEFLGLKYTKIKMLPLSITNLVGLKTLQLSACKSLRSLPNLPRLLEKLDARGCWSLETVDSTAVTLGNLDQIWDQGLECRDEERIFSSCVSLNQNSRRNIMVDARLRIVRMATALLAKPEAINFVQNYYEEHYTVPFSVTVVCPGNKIPEWFSCETEGRSINIKLPLHWYDANFLGFAVSVVVGQYRGHVLDFEFRCKSSFKTTDGESCYFRTAVRKYVGPRLRYEDDNVDHVLVWYQPSERSSTNLASATEASFRFTATEYAYEPSAIGTTDINNIIQSCGVCFLYSQANDINFEVIVRPML